MIRATSSGVVLEIFLAVEEITKDVYAARSRRG